MIINTQTLPTFLIGNPISHSKSPQFQNAAFEDQKINSVYLSLNIEKKDFDKAIQGLKKLDILGMNITLPYKTEIIKYLDELSDESNMIGAVNTVEIKDKYWIGHNTDWYGVYKSLENKKISKIQNALIIGAGGAANGVIYGLKKYGIENIVNTNRTMEKVQVNKKIFNIDIIDFKAYRNKIKFFTLIINATTLNFKDLVDNFDESKLYFDLKYYNNKPKIENYIDGSEMLLYQGARSFEIWTKIEAPIEIMRQALNKE